MKKLLTLATVLVLMLCMTSQTLAADIVVKKVTIKKRNVAKVASGTTALYHFWADCWDMTITKGPGAKEDQTIFTFSTTIAPDKDNTMSTATMEITVLDCNLKAITKTLTMTAGKDNTYTASISLPSTKGCALILTAAEIDATNTKGEIAAFEAELDKTTDPDKGCNGSTNLKNVDYATESTSGFYAMSFSMAFEKELPAGATMIVLVTNCKGENAKVAVKLAYDPATGVAMGSTGIMQNKDCPWALTYGEVYSIDPCGTESAWAVNFGEVKTNGTGTRSGAASVKSKPTLK